MFKDFTKYEVYPDGKIWSYNKNRFLKPQTNKNGYKQVMLTDNEGKRKLYYLHRVVWESVTGEPIPKGYEINHIDENKENNSRSNLELLSHKENLNFGSCIKRAAKSRSKQVGAFKDGELVMKFQSSVEAVRNGFTKRSVSACCRGERKTHKGFQWRYI